MTSYFIPFKTWVTFTVVVKGIRMKLWVKRLWKSPFLLGTNPAFSRQFQKYKKTYFLLFHRWGKIHFCTKKRFITSKVPKMQFLLDLKVLIFGLKLYFFYISGHSGGGEREGNKCSNENEASLLKKLFDDLLLWRRGYHEGFIFVDWFTIILKIYIEFLYIFFFF